MKTPAVLHYGRKQRRFKQLEPPVALQRRLKRLEPAVSSLRRRLKRAEPAPSLPRRFERLEPAVSLLRRATSARRLRRRGHHGLRLGNGSFRVRSGGGRLTGRRR
jgi:hypothetical protein